VIGTGVGSVATLLKLPDEEKGSQLLPTAFGRNKMVWRVPSPGETGAGGD